MNLLSKKYLFFHLLILIVFSGCSSEKAGLRELKKLCEKDAGLTIYKTVEADGYFDATGGFDLVLSPYNFYEFCDDSPSPSKFNVIPEPGCYRVEKVQRETGQCHQGYDKALAKVVVEPYPEFLKETCIAVKKIEKPAAQYSYHSSIEFWPDKNGVSEFGRSHLQLKEIKSDEVLGEYISYSYNKLPKHTSPKSCRLLDDRFFISIKDDFLVKTIVPHKGER